VSDGAHDASDENIRLIVRGLSSLEVDALTRFYVLEHTPEQIHKDLGMAANHLHELQAQSPGGISENEKASIKDFLHGPHDDVRPIELDPMPTALDNFHPSLGRLAGNPFMIRSLSRTRIVR
jgi:hypothetical protein